MTTAALRLVAGLATLTLAACAAPVGDEAPGETGEAIVNGTPVNLQANSFVRLPATGCSGTLLTNDWVLTASRCLPKVNDPVQMDAQSRTVRRVVAGPPYSNVSLAQLSSPMAVGGKTSGFRRMLRTTAAPAGSHVRCYGYGVSKYGGIGTQLTYTELHVNRVVPMQPPPGSVYVFEFGAGKPYPGVGDSGGACLDDSGAAIGVQDPSLYNGQIGAAEAMIASSFYASWANEFAF